MQTILFDSLDFNYEVWLIALMINLLKKNEQTTIKYLFIDENKLE